MRTFFTAATLTALSSAFQEFNPILDSNLPLDVEGSYSNDTNWQQYPKWCYTINGRKQVVYITCGPDFSRTQQCEWSAGGGYRVWMHSGETSYVTFSDQYTDSRRAFGYLMPNLLGGKVKFTISAH